MILGRATSAAVLVLSVSLGGSLVVFTIAAAIALVRGSITLTGGEISLISTLAGILAGALATYLGFGHPNRVGNPTSTEPLPSEDYTEGQS